MNPSLILKLVLQQTHLKLGSRVFKKKSSTRQLSTVSSAASIEKKLKVAVFSTKPYDETYITKANIGYDHELVFYPELLNRHTAVLAEGFDAVCVFVNDMLGKPCLEQLHKRGVKHIALRCAGFDALDIKEALNYGFNVARVPAYSPYAVAEHAVALLLCTVRSIHKGYNRVRDGNFALQGLMGFDLYGKTVGIVGTGKIGAITGNILKGFGCRIIAFDKFPSQTCKDNGFEYVTLPELFAQSHIISLHCPLTVDTKHMINIESLDLMKQGVVIINTSRGGLINTKAAIEGIKSGRISRMGLDVYEHERELFFEDLSHEVIQDDDFQLLNAYTNVVITGHQAFFTEEALSNIAETTISNINDFANGIESPNSVFKVIKK